MHPILLAGVCCRFCCNLTVGRHSRHEVLFTVTIAVLVIALELTKVHCLIGPPF